MVRHADMDMTVTSEEVSTQTSLETGGRACHAGPLRKH